MNGLIKHLEQMLQIVSGYWLLVVRIKPLQVASSQVNSQFLVGLLRFLLHCKLPSFYSVWRRGNAAEISIAEGGGKRKDYSRAGWREEVKTVSEKTDIPAHAPVALDEGGDLVAVTKENIAKIYGVLPEAAKEGEETVVYLTGEYFADSLALEKAVTLADVEVPLRNIGIFLK